MLWVCVNQGWGPLCESRWEQQSSIFFILPHTAKDREKITEEIKETENEITAVAVN